MCRALTEGGRRCPVHTPEGRAVQRAVARATDQSLTTRERTRALRNARPAVVEATAERLTDPEDFEIAEAEADLVGLDDWWGAELEEERRAIVTAPEASAGVLVAAVLDHARTEPGVAAEALWHLAHHPDYAGCDLSALTHGTPLVYVPTLGPIDGLARYAEEEAEREEQAAREAARREAERDRLVAAQVAEQQRRVDAAERREAREEAARQREALRARREEEREAAARQREAERHQAREDAARAREWAQREREVEARWQAKARRWLDYDSRTIPERMAMKERLEAPVAAVTLDPEPLRARGMDETPEEYAAYVEAHGARAAAREAEAAERRARWEAAAPQRAEEAARQRAALAERQREYERGAAETRAWSRSLAAFGYDRRRRRLALAVMDRPGDRRAKEKLAAYVAGQAKAAQKGRAAVLRRRRAAAARGLSKNKRYKTKRHRSAAERFGTWIWSL